MTQATATLAAALESHPGTAAINIRVAIRTRPAHRRAAWMETAAGWLKTHDADTVARALKGDYSGLTPCSP